MLERYNHIKAKLSEAKAIGDSAKVKQWRQKLQDWQTQYGSYSPQ